jgi:hypothetical protein
MNGPRDKPSVRYNCDERPFYLEESGNSLQDPGKDLVGIVCHVDLLAQTVKQNEPIK